MSTPSRVCAGVPTGGQFAASQHSESGVVLESPFKVVGPDGTGGEDDRRAMAVQAGALADARRQASQRPRISEYTHLIEDPPNDDPDGDAPQIAAPAGRSSGIPEPANDLQQAVYDRYAAVHGWSDWPSAAERGSFDAGRAKGLEMTWARPGDIKPGDTVVFRNTVLDIAEVQPPTDGQVGGVTVLAKVRDGKVRGKTAGTVNLAADAHVPVVAANDTSRAALAAELAGTAATVLPKRPARRASAPQQSYDDAIIGGWTPADVSKHFGFDGMTDRVKYGYPSGGRPFSITAQTVNRKPGFEVTDTRTGARLRVGSKRAATRVAKQIEADYYDRPSTATPETKEV